MPEPPSVLPELLVLVTPASPLLLELVVALTSGAPASLAFLPLPVLPVAVVVVEVAPASALRPRRVV